MEDERTELQLLIADIERTPGVRRAVAPKKQLFVEGSFPVSELKRGNVNKVVISALNRIRKKSKLAPLPFKQWHLEWYELRQDVMEYRIYAIGAPKRGVS